MGRSSGVPEEGGQGHWLAIYTCGRDKNLVIRSEKLAWMALSKCSVTVLNGGFMASFAQTEVGRTH